MKKEIVAVVLITIILVPLMSGSELERWIIVHFTSALQQLAELLQ